MTTLNGNFLIVLDFDGTFTLLPHENNSTWSRTDNFILDEEKRKLVQFVRRFFTNRKERIGLSDEAEEIWFEMSLQNWIERGLSRVHIAETFARNEEHLRPGLPEFLHWLKRPRNGTTVHTAVNSYGFVSIIDHILTKMGVRQLVDKICASELNFDESGFVTGHKKDTFIGTTNKGVATQKMMEDWGISPEKTIGIGDSSGDKLIAPEHRLLLAFDEQQVGHYGSHFTDTVISADWGGARKWLERNFSL